MPVLFEGNTGRVFAVPDRVAAGSLQLANVDSISGNAAGPPNPSTSGRVTYQYHNTIITGLGVSAAGNFQFLHTIGNDVYVYVFGDRMGQVMLSGLSFAQQCNNGQPQADHGFELLLRWYQANRIAARKAPVRVNIGRSTNFDGFVTGLTGDVQDSLHRTIQFQMSISLLPDAVN